MKIIAYLFATVWFIAFLAYCFTDYTPSSFTIGCALALSAICLLKDAREYE